MKLKVAKYGNFGGHITKFFLPVERRETFYVIMFEHSELSVKKHHFLEDEKSR